MTIRICSAALILALWSSGLDAVPATGALAILVRAYREAPSPARRGAIAAYIAGHPKDAALANLALGIAAYEQKNYAGAIAELKPVQGKLAPLADYAAYYLALARVEANDFERFRGGSGRGAPQFAAQRQELAGGGARAQGGGARRTPSACCATITPNCRSPKAT